MVKEEKTRKQVRVQKIVQNNYEQRQFIKDRINDFRK